MRRITFGKSNAMRNILLPTDFSANSLNAINFAIKLFEGETCTFYILNSEKPSNYITAEVLQATPGTSVYEGILSDNKEKLENMVQFCESVSIKQDFIFVPKLDFDTIVAAVNQAVALNNIELIIMGTNGATSAEEVIFGSNTLKIIRNVNCPVIIVPEEYNFEKIKSVLLSFSCQDNINAKNTEILLAILKKTQADLKILEIGEEKNDLLDQRTIFNEVFKEIDFEYFTIKDLTAPMAISAFEQLMPVQLHTMIVEPENIFDRLIFGSDTSTISYGTHIPLLVLHKVL